MKSQPVNPVSKPPRILPVATDGARPFWSVMIPTYNPRADYLEATLRCVLSQDPGPGQMQIEVVDDSSPNGAPVELVRRLAGDRVSVYREPKNNGLAGIWNRCIERANGEWVHILHQDDLVFPGYYESLRRGIAAHPQAGAAACRHAYCDENGHWHRLSILEMPAPGVLNGFLERLVSAERVQCAAMTVRRSTYEQLGGFNPELKHALDWEIWIRIANQFPIFYEPAILACWRNHSGATTSRQIRSGENIRDIAKAIDVWSSYLPAVEAGRLAGIARRRFAGEALFMAGCLLEQNDFEGCLNQARAALVCQNNFQLRAAALNLRCRAQFLRAISPLRVWGGRNIKSPLKKWLKPG